MHLRPVGLGGRRTQNSFFKDGYRPQKAILENFLEFSPPISDICLYHHFCEQLNLPFSELNITPSVRPNLGIFKNFWYWISIFRQSSLVKKTQFELNLTSFKWALPRSAPPGPPSARLGKCLSISSFQNSRKKFNFVQFCGFGQKLFQSSIKLSWMWHFFSKSRK